MSEITAADVAELRRITGAGMMDCKRALQDAAGNLDQAIELLRERGAAAAAKRSDREASDGTIGHYLHRQAGRPVLGVLVELSSETDFVAKSEPFQEAATDLAMHIAAFSPRWVRREDVPESVLEHEKTIYAKQAANEGKPESVIPRIVEGKINKFFADTVLYEQQFVNGEKFDGTVAQMIEQLTASLGEKIEVRRFVRLKVADDEA